jgi:hypothetical protein
MVDATVGDSVRDAQIAATCRERAAEIVQGVMRERRAFVETCLCLAEARRGRGAVGAEEIFAILDAWQALQDNLSSLIYARARGRRVSVRAELWGHFPTGGVSQKWHGVLSACSLSEKTKK